ncbi:MAG: molybdopterin-dependent oxidoreductase [Bryobacterales bacterium]|nr:molybdopterin-dependent oxidoreductase [Bryobacterales bacterium]
MTRRDLFRQFARAAAIAAAQAAFPAITFTASKIDVPLDSLTWKKAPCRFCGTGCGLLIGLKEGRALAVKGDPASAVNQGLACVKGYHSIMALYGSDRLKYAQVRKNGQMVKVPMSEALDIIANKMKETIAKHGKDSVAMYGSGQWTIPDGYVASKLFKGAIGTNNVEANARLCMASAVTGFMTSFGLDEPMGCYEDIDHADVFVLWGNNMAEMHPVLFSRMLDQRLKRPEVKIIDFATRSTRTSIASNKSILFKPHTDLAVANAIAYEILRNGWHNQAFLDRHVSMHTGKTNIGFGLEDNFKFEDEAKTIDLAQYRKLLEDYTPEKVEAMSGVRAEDIRYMASLYGDPKTKVVSYWCMGMNQHTRGTWIQNLVYNIHLLTGKISQPGNGPFSLTGQPSACGTVREVGTLTHKLPHGVVNNEADRKMAAEIWNVPAENISPKPTYHTVEMFRALDRGDIRFMWIQVTNPMVTMPNLKRYRDGALKEDRFVVVSEVYPTPTTDVADVILPSAMWVEREGMFGNSERRTQHWDQLLEPPGEAMSDTWQLIEVARRLGFTKQFPWKQEEHVEEVWKEYRRFHEGPKHNMASYEDLKANPGVIWPYVNGKETKWRYNAKYDPACKQEPFDFYGKPDHKAWIWFRPYEAPPEEPDEEYPFWLNTGRVVEHWHTGTMTRRIPVLHKAMPAAYVGTAISGGRKGTGTSADSNTVKLASSPRHHSCLPAAIDRRGRPQKGMVFVPFFDEGKLINELTLDAFCPISKQPDYKKCSVRITKA